MQQDKNSQLLLSPYGSAAETYAKANGIHYSSQTSLQIQPGYSKLYVGENRQIAVLNASVTPVWKSSNNSVMSGRCRRKLIAKNPELQNNCNNRKKDIYISLYRGYPDTEKRAGYYLESLRDIRDE